MSKPKLKLKPCSTYLGADPELFLSLGGRIVGSEKFIPKEGISVHNGGRIVRDGVQVELQVSAFTCRQSARQYYAALMEVLYTHLKQTKKGLTVDWSRTIEVNEEEFETLSEESKQLGCMPSLNIYEDRPIVVENPRIRSAGGHIHIGCGGVSDLIKPKPDLLVKLLDIVVGNTCVLFDQDPGVRIRRQTYGRAGEYRLPQHGLEYRVLSNFWLHSYPAMSMVNGMVRLATMIAWTQLSQNNQKNPYREDLTGYYKKQYTPKELEGYAEQWEVTNRGFDAATMLLDQVDIKRVIHAINENDPAEARVTFEILKQFVDANCSDYQPSISGGPALYPSNIQDFEFLIQEGFSRFTDKDPFINWMNSLNYTGFESWLHRVVQPARIEAARKSKKRSITLAMKGAA